MDDQNVNAQAGSHLKLSPLPLWKWLVAILFLLSLPVAVLIKQAVGSFSSTASAARDEIGREVEKLSSRIAFESKTNLQIRALLSEYVAVNDVNMMTAFYLEAIYGKTLLMLPREFSVGLTLAARNLAAQQHRLEKKLKRLIPGLKMLKWNNKQQLTADSDLLLPRWAYQKLHESIIKNINYKSDQSGSGMGFLENLPVLTRYFGEAPAFGSFIKSAGELVECINPNGSKLYLFWENQNIYAFDGTRVHAGGFIAVIEAAALPRSFGHETLLLRKSHEWSKSGISSGWIAEDAPEKHFLPYPFPSTDKDAWIAWLIAKPDGLHERQGLIVSIRRSSDGLMLLAVASARKISEDFSRSIFWLSVFLLLAIAVPAALVLGNRSNNGMAMSIRMQIAGLFVFALALPGAVIFQLGTELLKDRQKAYENEAYQDIERVKKDLDENLGYAFRHLEQISDRAGKRIMQLDLDHNGKVVRPEAAKEILRSYVDQVNYLHCYLFNSSADLMLIDSNRDEEKDARSLLPLVQSLAKIKLRAGGQLKSSGHIGDISMIDLLVESTGGANLDDIQAILRTRENRAFELKFSGRRSVFFLGQYFPKSRPDEAYILVFLIRDSQFEKMYMRLMIDKLSEQPLLKNRIQLFFGENDAGGSGYFYSSPLQNAWFPFVENSPDSLRLGRLSEPTRFSGNSVKESVILETDQRKCLFYSFKPANMELNSVVALFDYTEIAGELQQLRNFILISFLVSLTVVLVLARVMARSLIEPVGLLKKGVQQIEAGNYQTELILPGQDEMVELAHAFNNMSRGLDERARMTRYLSRSAVDAVVSGEDRVMGGKRVPATILFSDIRGFTTISESNSPEDVVNLLNEYFAVMNCVVEGYGGDIDKFIGDAIMAQFIIGENMRPDELALNAVKCALAMMTALDRFNQERVTRGLFPLKIGVGINSGDVIAGNIGSPGRMDRTVIGDTVNVASRLEGMSKLGRHTCVIISKATLELVKEYVEVEQLAETAVKGKTSAVEMFEIVCLNSYN